MRGGLGKGEKSQDSRLKLTLLFQKKKKNHAYNPPPSIPLAARELRCIIPAEGKLRQSRSTVYWGRAKRLGSTGAQYVETRRESELILPKEALPKKPTSDVDTSGGKRAQRVKAGGSELPYSSTPSLKITGNTHTQGQQSVRRAALPDVPATGPLRPGARVPRLQSEGAGARTRAEPPGCGVGLPTLSSTKSPSRGRRRRPPRVPLGRCPITRADVDSEAPWCQRAPPVAAHKGELGLRPQTLGAEGAPGGLMLPFQSPCACCLSYFAPGVLQECARRCCSLTAKDGEGGDWSGRGSAAAATAAARGGSGVRVVNERRGHCAQPAAALWQQGYSLLGCGLMK